MAKSLYLVTRGDESVGVYTRGDALELTQMTPREFRRCYERGVEINGYLIHRANEPYARTVDTSYTIPVKLAYDWDETMEWLRPLVKGTNIKLTYKGR